MVLRGVVVRGKGRWLGQQGCGGAGCGRGGPARGEKRRGTLACVRAGGGPDSTTTSTKDATTGFGVVLVDHGSKKEESNAMLEEFAELYRETSGRALVEVAHMEIAEPSIPTALEKCVEKGAKEIVVAPYFLSPGRHIQKDIPRIVEEAAKNFPGVSIEIAKPIGLHPLVAQVIEQRVKETE
ncbi:cobalamin biosynthesis protein CbiX [Chloropicon primus]|uniref:Cobalamin biosynthesis protein CbiX n=1 Tax=Chloropicon primus TaxID=1764295 RepID=A0A5B8MJ95_9CHLO|nr:cobalamin biosynthesis protein CbiX [Chloropicon primus]UPQ99707.1 cobalamin biosynthesis protein CbiX [Chloropicon primus]|eukprot:QDZ20497.1 cobalamin biosynthesis protein CbiX [Chloropicon primus]